MDLLAVLNANKKKIADTKSSLRRPAGIATTDRPYDPDIQKKAIATEQVTQEIPDNQITPAGKLQSHTSSVTKDLVGPEHDPKNLATGHEITNKPDTNSTQSTHKLDTKTQHKVNTNPTQSEHKNISKAENQTQTKHKLNTKLNTQKTQSRHKVDTNQTQISKLSTVIGIQRMILLLLFEECKKARSCITEPVSIIHIASTLEIQPGSVKTSVARLCEKQLLKINHYKNGRGGWSVYEIPGDVYKDLLQMETQHKLHTNYTQSRHKVDTKLNTQPDTTSSSSSSKDIITTTTAMSEEWNFDIKPYLHFGFTTTQLRQLSHLNTISASDVQQSLVEFNYDIENNALPLIKTNRVNFLMGLFRRGSVYVSAGFRNEQELLIAEMAKRASQKKEDLLRDKFTAWESALTDEEKKQLERELSPRMMILFRTYGIKNHEIRDWLFNYFLQNTG